MELVIYNTLTQKKEAFVPLQSGQVKMYVCGPTVYGLLHVGNFRGPIFFNLVRNWLVSLGYQVEFAYNFTDVDDRIIQKAKDEELTAEQVAEKYIGEFKADFKALGLKPHTFNPKVTETMEKIVDMVRELIAAQKAYVAGSGDVYYSVRSFAEYGKLSHRNIDDLQVGARVEVDPNKRDPLDFALWKPAKPGEPHWSSPWGEGRPGWHIECSAMIRNLFGDTIDIHGGGRDLVFPHHENEVAQSEGVSGKPFVRYWMHNNMLTFGDKKMSKSLGNIMTTREFLERYDAEILKYMLLSVHYRSLSDFSEKAVHQAIVNLARIYSALQMAESLIAVGKEQHPPNLGAVAKPFAEVLVQGEGSVRRALNDDFNTPEMTAAIFGVVRSFNGIFRRGQRVTSDDMATASAFRTWILKVGSLAALFQENPAEYLTSLDDRLMDQMGLKRMEIEQKVKARQAARQAKDFALADEIRDELQNLGIALQDMPGETHWEVAK